MKLLTEQELTDSIASILGEVVKACYDLDQTKGKVVAVIDSSISEYKNFIQSQKQAHAGQQVLQALEEVKPLIAAEIYAPEQFESNKKETYQHGFNKASGMAIDALDQVATKYRGGEL